jgi:hypothetical protein
VASYTVASGLIACHDKVLTASTVDTVDFAEDTEYVEIVSSGDAKIYVSADGSTPTVSGGNTYVVPAVACARTFRHWKPDGVVKLISSGTPTYSVTLV